jgi:hypothetical protein
LDINNQDKNSGEFSPEFLSSRLGACLKVQLALYWLLKKIEDALLNKDCADGAEKKL